MLVVAQEVIPFFHSPQQGLVLLKPYLSVQEVQEVQVELAMVKLVQMEQTGVLLLSAV